MQTLNLELIADYLESATITATHDFGHAIVHAGTSAAGAQFVMMNDMWGETTITESA